MVNIHERTISIMNESEWGPPGAFFYDFLSDIEKEKLPKHICFLGCGDGRYVVPALVQGFYCTAVDIDEIALNKMRGRIQLDDNSSGLLEILSKDFFKETSQISYPATFVTAALHYDVNSSYSLKEKIQKINSYVQPGGLLLHEYIHYSERNHETEKYFTSDQLALCYDTGWEIINNKVEVFNDGPNPRRPYPAQLAWGTFYAKRHTKM